MSILKIILLVISYSLYCFNSLADSSDSQMVRIGLNNNNLDLERTSASVNRRGSGYEIRFSKDKKATFVFNSPVAAHFEISANYSSKNYATDVILKNATSEAILNAKETKGHGNFTSAKFISTIKLVQGSNTIELISKRPNFYLKKLVLNEVDNVITHSIPSKIKSWEFSESSQSVTKSPRGSSYEMRFKRGLSLSYAINNSAQEKSFDLYLEYSSKKRVPKLDISLDDTPLSVEQLSETSGHGSFKKLIALKGITIPSGKSTLKIQSNSDNFYLKYLSVVEAPDRVAPVIHELPGQINATKYTDSNMDVKKAKRGSSYEVRLASNQKIAYTIENKSNVNMKFDIKLNYSSARTTPKINLKIGDKLFENITLEKTDSHGKYITRALVEGVSISPGVHRLELHTLRQNLYFKKMDAKEAVESVKAKIYQINVGGAAFDSWMSDKNTNNEIKNYFDNTNRMFYMIGSEDAAISSVDLNALAIDESVPSDLNLEVLRTARSDKFDSDHHIPGIHYDFALAPGEYEVILHFIQNNQDSSIRIVTNASTSSEIFNIPAQSENSAYSVKFQISHQEAKDLKLGILANSFKDDFKLAGLEILSSTDSFDIPVAEPTRYYVSPHGAGNKSGSSAQNAKAFKDINGLISKLSSTGGEILLLSNKGIYNITKSMNISKGSLDELNPITIKTLRANESSTKAIFRGTRQAPWVDKSSNSGKEFMRLMSGANNLIFEDIEFQNFGNGIFRIANPIKNLVLSKIRAKNFTRLIENYKSGSGSHASVENLNIENIEALGYTRGVMRLKYSSKNITIDKVLGDSQKQLDKDDFPMGVAIDNNVHKVVISKSLFKNHRQKKSSNSSYFNGDGVATESNVDDVTIEDTISSLNSDGGFDLKSTNTRIIRSLASENKRNYRFWNPAILSNVRSVNPVKYGGSGNKIHFGNYGSRSFVVEIENVDVLDSTSNARVFSVGEAQNSRMKIFSGQIVIEGSADLMDSPGRVEISPETKINP